MVKVGVVVAIHRALPTSHYLYLMQSYANCRRAVVRVEVICFSAISFNAKLSGQLPVTSATLKYILT